ncbi:hypothetical protein HYQ46_002177 [Verticillium longisporum]|nr:predicted protein [Verticillium alfalfae VaMs.102]EEY24000.1 predicted protein [Verticillium alfalfae VaMs.102]KAG7152964.1 hypothetical protein HYQ46_002177 [Verticillium longisporum]
MTTLSPPLHPASLDVGTATAPLEEYTAEAVRRAAEALIQIRAGDSGDAGDSGNAVEPSQQCLSPSIIQDNVTQVSEACFTPPDVCLAEWTLDLDREPLDAASLEDAFAQLETRRRAEQALSSSATPTSPVSKPATSAERGPLCNGCASSLSNDSCASLSLPSPLPPPPSPPATRARRPLPSHGRPREARQDYLSAAASQRVGRKRGGKPQSKTRRRTRQRASNQQRTPQQRGAGKEFFLASAVAFQTDNHELVFTPQRRSRVWVSEAGPARIELEPESLPETPRWIDVHPGGVASYAVRLSWHADLELLCGLDEIRGMTLAISREMAQDLLLAIGESHQFDSEALKLLSKGLTE